MEGYDEVSIYIWHEQVNEYAMGNKTKDQAIMGFKKAAGEHWGITVK